MKMNRIFGSLSLLMVTSFAVPTHAQQLDVPSFVDLTTKGTDIANRCAAMTNNFLTVKVPADHATARATVAANAISPAAKQLPVSAENTTYISQVNSFKLLLSSCGKQFAAVNGPIHQNTVRFAAMMSKDTMPHPDAQKVANAIKGYTDAHQKLVKAILALSSDKQVESYLSDVISRDFIEPAKTTNQ